MSAATVTYHELPPVSSWASIPQQSAEHSFFSNALLPSLTSTADATTHVFSNESLHCFDTAAANFWNIGYAEASEAQSMCSATQSTAATVTSPCWSQAAAANFGTLPAAAAVAYGSLTTTIVGRNGSFQTEVRSKKRSAPLKCTTTMPLNSATIEEICLVCGDKASGYHYNSLTCEEDPLNLYCQLRKTTAYTFSWISGCKGFFRRSITRKAMYYCKYGGSCDIDMYMRRKCQACRLRKCLEVGMRPELVIPEDQCRMKRESKLKNRANSEERKSTSPQQVTSTESLSPINNYSSASTTNTLTALSPEQRELIHRLVLYQEQFDMPSDEDLSKLSTFQECGAGENAHFQHLAELTILSVQLIMEFAKNLPGFSTLTNADQLKLLKACSTEVLMLRTARRYDAKHDTIVLGNQTTSWAYTRDAYKQGIGVASDATFDFAKSMAKLKVDNAEYALLTAITIFSERAGLSEVRKIEDIQEVYASTLQAYIEVHRPKQRMMFARLLMKLTDLRTLGSEHADSLFSLKMENNHGKTAALSQQTSIVISNSNTFNQPTATSASFDETNSHGFYYAPQTDTQNQASGINGFWNVTSSGQSSTYCNEAPLLSIATTTRATTKPTHTQPSAGRIPNVRIKIEPLQTSECDSEQQFVDFNCGKTRTMQHNNLLEKAVNIPELKMEHCVS